jgi:hypothetical protein
MANKKHLRILEEGVDHWNQWRKDNPLVKPNLFNANLFYDNLKNANLSDSDLRNANLFNANLFNANLSNAKLLNANLISADLSNASLSNADLISADLSDASLIKADLLNADLSRARVLNAQFQGARLTGVCIEDWNINYETNLDGVVCDYMYRRHNKQERLPSDRNFAPGEFTKLHQKLENVVELIFHNGLNWRAFAFAFNEVNAQIIDTDVNGEMFLREYKVLGDGLVALKVVTPPKADKSKIHGELMIAYERISRLEGELKGKDAILAGVLDKVFSMAGDTYNNYHYGNVANSANKLEGNARQQANQYNYTAEQKQILIETAQEIQQIYDHLLQTQPSKAWDELELTKQVKAELEKRPTLKERFVGLLKNGGAEALKELVNRSGFNILLEAARGWMNPE